MLMDTMLNGCFNIFWGDIFFMEKKNSTLGKLEKYRDFLPTN